MQCFYGTGSNRSSNNPGPDRSRVFSGLLGTVPIGTANRFQLGLLSN